MDKTTIIEIFKKFPELKEHLVPQDIHNLTPNMSFKEQINFIKNKIENANTVALTIKEQNALLPVAIHLYNNDDVLVNIPEDASMISDFDKKYLLASIIQNKQIILVDSPHFIGNEETLNKKHLYSNNLNIDEIANSILVKEKTSSNNNEELEYKEPQKTFSDYMFLWTYTKDTNEKQKIIDNIKDLPKIFFKASTITMMEIPEDTFTQIVMKVKEQTNEFDFLSIIINSWNTMKTGLFSKIHHPHNDFLETLIVKELNSGTDESRIKKFNQHIMKNPDIFKLLEVNDFFFQQDSVIKNVFSSGSLDLFKIQSEFWKSIDGLERIQKNNPEFFDSANQNPVWAKSLVTYYCTQPDDIFYRYMDLGAPTVKVFNELLAQKDSLKRIQSVKFYEYFYKKDLEALTKISKKYSCQEFILLKTKEILAHPDIQLTTEQQSFFLQNISHIEEDSKEQWFKKFIAVSSFPVFDKLNSYDLSSEFLQKFQQDFLTSLQSFITLINSNGTQNPNFAANSKISLPLPFLQKILDVSTLDTKKAFVECVPELLALPSMKELQKDVPTVLKFLKNNKEFSRFKDATSHLTSKIEFPLQMFFNKEICLECINSSNSRFIQNIPTIQFNDLTFLSQYFEKMEKLYSERKTLCEESTLPPSIISLIAKAPEGITIQEFIIAKLQNESISKSFNELMNLGNDSISYDMPLHKI